MTLLWDGFLILTVFEAKSEKFPISIVVIA